MSTCPVCKWNGEPSRGAVAWHCPECGVIFAHPHGWKSKEKTQLLPGTEKTESYVIPTVLKLIPEFEEAWKDFDRQRKSKKAKLTPRAAKVILGKLSQRPDIALRILDLVIEKNWLSFDWDWPEVAALSKVPESKKPTITLPDYWPAFIDLMKAKYPKRHAELEAARSDIAKAREIKSTLAAEFASFKQSSVSTSRNQEPNQP
jgi:hypothetical protein